MGLLVALATFISFVLAPIVGYMNLRNVMSADLPATLRPGKPLQLLTYAGIIFLSLFAAYYCWLVIF
jgi:hypothetical protein